MIWVMREEKATANVFNLYCEVKAKESRTGQGHMHLKPDIAQCQGANDSSWDCLSGLWLQMIGSCRLSDQSCPVFVWGETYHCTAAHLAPRKAVVCHTLSWSFILCSDRIFIFVKNRATLHLVFLLNMINYICPLIKRISLDMYQKDWGYRYPKDLFLSYNIMYCGIYIFLNRRCGCK